MCCASSYAVNDFTLNYLYERIVSGSPTIDCGQGYCYRRSYTIDLSITKEPGFVVTKTVLSGGECCYRGTGSVTITGTVQFEEFFDGISICPPPYNVGWNQTHTFRFERTTCACITVRCDSKVDHCDGTSAPALQHTLEIGDFVVECSAEYVEADCDTCPVPMGPFSLRCIGGRFAFKSSVNCLNVVTDRECLGWWPKTQQYCGDGEAYGPCFYNLEEAVVTHGPFAIITETECAEGIDDYPCLDGGAAPFGLVLETRGDEIPAILTQLQSPCANVDTDYTPCIGINVAIRQQGGCPFHWTYS